MLQSLLTPARLSAAAVALVAVGLAASPLQAQTVLLSGYDTTGADMAGATISASFLDGTTEFLTWGAQPALGAQAGGVFSQGWSLTQQGNSFWSPWTLTVGPSLTLQSLVIDLVGGNAVFDTLVDSTADTNTPGSEQGEPFRLKNKSTHPLLVPTTIDYSAPIDISKGDLFSQLTLEWENGFSNNVFQFVTDTDSGTTSNPVTVVETPKNLTLVSPIEPIEPMETIETTVTRVEEPQATAVPEPGAVLGLLAIATLSRKQKSDRPLAG